MKLFFCSNIDSESCCSFSILEVKKSKRIQTPIYKINIKNIAKWFRKIIFAIIARSASIIFMSIKRSAHKNIIKSKIHPSKQ